MFPLRLTLTKTARIKCNHTSALTLLKLFIKQNYKLLGLVNSPSGHHLHLDLVMVYPVVKFRLLVVKPIFTSIGSTSADNTCPFSSYINIYAQMHMCGCTCIHTCLNSTP
ncbi:hypothetical protein M758_6G058900 [Ceratodon purpureus]|nr:hypothetical protein M758_6G058900 [Ceratodon purpureus]